MAVNGVQYVGISDHRTKRYAEVTAHEGLLATEANSVKGTFETDPISALGLPPPVSIATDATVGAALAAVQKQGRGYVLIVEGGRPRGIMSERDVLMKIAARDVKYDTNVMEFASRIPVTLTAREKIARAIKVMIAEGIEQVPVVDASGKATAVLRTLDVIHFLAEAFPEQLLNLPPRPHQILPKPEGG
jgi:CBS domain-containing protein